MAFKNGLSERLDELRFPSPRSPPSDSAYNPLSPGSSNFGSGFSRPNSDVRANLQRRFTTDSSKLSSWNFLNQGTPQMPDTLDLLSSFEKKRQHIESMREQKRRFEEDMKLLDIQHEKEKMEMDQLALDLAKAGIAGRASQPTTPRIPVTSSPGFFSAFAPSVTSPQNQGSQNARSHAQSMDRFAVHSLPGSRRNSEKDNFLFDSTVIDSTIRGTSHRNSMPSNNHYNAYRSNGIVHTGNANGNANGNVNGYMNSFNPASGFDSFPVAKHLYHGDAGFLAKDEPRLSTPDITRYINMTDPEDKFPTLRRDGSNMLAANPDAHDLANPRGLGHETYSYHSRNRSSHQSMPPSLTEMRRHDRLDSLGGGHAEDTLIHRHQARHSLEGGPVFPNERESVTPVPSYSRPMARISYSTNDVPTVRGTAFEAAITPPRTNVDRGHRHTPSVGRIPPSVHSHQSRTSPDSEQQINQLGQTMLQASAAPFGPQLTSATLNNSLNGSAAPIGLPFPAQSHVVNGAQPYGTASNQMTLFTDPNPYGGFSNHAGNGYRASEVPTRSGHSQRRATESEASQYQIVRDIPNQNRFDGPQQTRFNHPLEYYKGQLYSLCKDQHGCRFLQRKLDDNNSDHVQLIFQETYPYVTELMTDPFGNYLIQKLLELSNNEQRTILIKNAAPLLVETAFNQHGTRALQKMIETISTQEQTDMVIEALGQHVVAMVKDINGNHVIQKCLNRLRSVDADFIYEAVGQNCISVGTHRHGCCVLQRCLDHASGDQKARLVDQITQNSYILVQDPYGNYVIQYILDMNEPSFTAPLCQGFFGKVVTMAMHKFSSNVIEKGLRTCLPGHRRQMIAEMVHHENFPECLRDAYGNYVIQTAMDHADPESLAEIIEAIRPILPSFRQTPHGRRIASRILAIETSGRLPAEHPVREVNAPNQVAKPSTKKNHLSQGSVNDFANQTFPPTPATSSTANTPLVEAKNSP
ncbi:hypothetical protein N7454_008236 [Penicillium verhagenii]|nr:hypothetical protein N7454_008236 [Penicillium verhagenii]